jgi:DNA-binding winged helix-turn-helix (wHTH) protein
MTSVHPIHFVPGEKIAANAANEGIPVAAIARILNTPIEDVYGSLKEQKSRGVIGDMPRADWPPGVAIHSRIPTPTSPSDDDLQFMCKKTFHLTTLEAGFLVVLLRHRQVEKTRLHNIVEQQRSTRANQPSRTEATDPKMVDVMICKLRKKLKVIDTALKIATIWGGGYYIENDVKPLILAYVNGVPDAPPKEAAPARLNDKGPTGPTHA